ncbi:MAG: hypothetical protein A3F72_16990 [Bacteroidetes bacterium RIFCSPLOWO2_12_FULL_35_15]|nr:MAG: hypothetical protein A3F72_16990 [Bacteroidetes bacterium RIFCSPLOWO2_12_FULL_35_15]
MINKSTIQFLAQLSKNNNKEWFDKNRPSYEMAKNNFKGFVEELILNVSKFDPSIKHLEAKDCIFRINRDVRFSKNKDPYKNNFGAILAPGGKKSFSAGYYFQLQPNASFVAGGVWQPPSPQINAIRQEIDYNAKEFKKIIGNKDFKKYFGELSTEDKLKSVPKGYDKTHPEIELLKYKSFIAVHHLKDKEVVAEAFLKNITTVFKAMYSFNLFLRRACD